MATLTYAELITKQEYVIPGASTPHSPGISTFIYAIAALVPAEVEV